MGLLEQIINGQDNRNGVTKEIDELAVKTNQRLNSLKRIEEECARLGQKFEMDYVIKSRRNGLPYDCVCDDEYDVVKDAQSAKSSLKGTLAIILCVRRYIFVNRGQDKTSFLAQNNLEHIQYWIDVLVKRAENGDKYSKAALSTRYFSFIGIYDDVKEMIQKSCDEELLNQYKEELKKECDLMDKVSLVSYAFFEQIGPERNEERNKLNMLAASLGSSEAYNQLFYEYGGLDTEEGRNCVLAGAACNDGEDAYRFQEMLGNAYCFGEHSFPANIDEGIKWHKLAASNGYEDSIYALKALEAEGVL